MVFAGMGMQATFYTGAVVAFIMGVIAAMLISSKVSQT